MRIEKKYELAVIKLFEAFADKHELDFDPKYDADFKSHIFTVSDYYVAIETAYIDLLNDAPKETFFQWYDYRMLGGKINYQSWVHGLRPENFIEHNAAELLQAKERVKQAKKLLLEQINADIFDEISTQMKAKKITMAKLAEMVGTTQQHISILLKRKKANFGTIVKIKNAIYGA